LVFVIDNGKLGVTLRFAWFFWFWSLTGSIPLGVTNCFLIPTPIAPFKRF
jgi:hypothetical protein